MTRCSIKINQDTKVRIESMIRMHLEKEIKSYMVHGKIAEAIEYAKHGMTYDKFLNLVFDSYEKSDS